MILNEETKNKFGYDISTLKLYSKNILIVKCDICSKIFEKESSKIFSARRNSRSDVDVCGTSSCIYTKRKSTMKERHGVENAGQSTFIREKIKKTCIDRYGGIGMASKDIRLKTKSTNIKKYGVENVFQSDLIKDKIKFSVFKKYGVDHTSQLDSTKNKIRNTLKEKYGNEVYTKTDNYKIKVKDTNNKKYGVDWYLQSADKKQKTKNYFKSNFGVENVSQTQMYKSTMKRDNLIRMYNKILSGDRLKHLYKPLFSLDEYNGVDCQYKFKCLKCNNEFLDNLDDGKLPECKICFPVTPHNKSKMEIELFEYLSSVLKIKNIILGDNTILNNKKMELDFYMPDYNLAIECNGNFWHSELNGKKDKFYHITKTNECQNLNIKLIHVFEDEWIYKRDIVCERIRSILKLSKEKIYANKCVIKSIDEQTSRDFLEKTHLQGNTVSSIRLGLFYEQKLISVMTFGNYRLALGSKTEKDCYELIRYSSSEFIVVGGSSKLLKYFIKNYNPKKIISYADKRWVSQNKNMYLDNGFKLISTTSPNYWYIDKKKYLNRYYRFVFRKSTLHKKLKFFDKNLTEWQNMQLNGYDRIWDCGNLKYELTLKD
jgi:hypothetical protein